MSAAVRKKIEKALGYAADCAAGTGFRPSERLEYARALRELAQAHYFMSLSERAQNDPTAWPVQDGPDSTARPETDR